MVGIERSYYKTKCNTCKHSLSCYLEGNNLSSLPSGPARACSRPIAAHYSFDMAQQVHYPFDPLQPGPMYFLTPRKCGIFGVCNEALPRQVNYLIDEAVDTGKGANNIISKLHHFFATHGSGEEEVHLHADNCAGQNKNNAMVHYLAWRVMTGLHKHITLSFLVVGHTKFAPDWCFGLLKKRLRLTKIGTLADIAKAVDDSAVVNVPQLCSTQERMVVVPTYNWKSELSHHFKIIPQLKSYHHFRFSCEYPGSVFLKEHADTHETQLRLTKSSSWSPTASQLPPIVSPNGLPPERQWYLYEYIREFCPDYAKDSVVPLPSVAKPGSKTHTATDTAPATKRARVTQT